MPVLLSSAGLDGGQALDLTVNPSPVSTGRDDRPSDCIVYFGFSDIFRISTMVVMENVGQKKLLQMVDYCHSVDR